MTVTLEEFTKDFTPEERQKWMTLLARAHEPATTPVLGFLGRGALKQPFGVHRPLSPLRAAGDIAAPPSAYIPRIQEVPLTAFGADAKSSTPMLSGDLVETSGANFPCFRPTALSDLPPERLIV